MYLRDQRAGMYSTSAFYIARSFAELPIHMLTGILGGVTTYYMYGMGMGALEFAFQSGLMITTSAAVFMAVSSVALNFEQSNQLAMPILTILFLFSGEPSPFTLYKGLLSVPFNSTWDMFQSLLSLQGIAPCPF